MNCGDKMSKKAFKKAVQKKATITGILVIAVIISLIGSSYSWINSEAINGEYNYFENDNFELSYSKGEKGYADVLSITNEKPMSDKEGSQKEPYRFSITNNNTEEKNYVLKINLDQAYIEADDCINKIIPTMYIKYKIDNEEPRLLAELSDKDYEIYLSKESIMPGSSEIHELRIWIDENSPKSVSNKHFHAVVEVESANKAETYKEFKKGQLVKLLNNDEYYVLKDSNKYNSKVTLISKYNISLLGEQDTKCMDNKNNTISKNSASCSTMKYNKAIELLYGDYLLRLQKSLKEFEKRIDNIEVRLLNKEEIENDNWVTNYNIWTQSSNDDINYNWTITVENNTYKLEETFVSYDNHGLRPVITIEKDNIQ